MVGRTKNDEHAVWREAVQSPSNVAATLLKVYSLNIKALLRVSNEGTPSKAIQL